MNITKVREVQEILINNPRGRRNVGGWVGVGGILTQQMSYRGNGEREGEKDRQKQRDRQTDRQIEDSNSKTSLLFQ